MITGTQLRHICPRLSTDRAESLAALMREILPKYGMNTPDRAEEFIATIIEESGEFTARTENMNYSPARLMVVWPSRFPTLTMARQYAGNPEKLANYVYAGRMGNGLPSTGDGYRFRGGGYIQLTGRAMYTLYAKYLKQDVGAVADLVRSTDRYALDSACWYFVRVAGLIDESERDEFMKITKTVNGGLTNWTARQKYLAKVKSVLGK
jgi:putative chitinase